MIISMLYRFNGIEIDLKRYEIREHGQALAIEPKVFDLIIYLIENRDRLISRDELFDKIWAGRTVSDTSLSNHIKSARKILGDNGDLQCVIKTVRSRGYQFIATIQEFSETALETNAPENVPASENHHSKNYQHDNSSLIKKSLIIMTALLMISAVIWLVFLTKEKEVNTPYLLVVPFSISSPNTGKWQAFSDQMTRELIQDLRKISGLKLVPPPSSFTYKSNKIRTRIKGQLPDVTHVLDGVVSEGIDGNLRITLELEDLSSGALLWDGDFDIEKDNKNLFVTQSHIASSVSKSLKVIILEQEERVLAQTPTSSLQAYKHYIQGQYLLSMMTYDSVLKAINYFNEAIKLDAQFEAAYIAKSNAYRIIMVLFDKPRNVLPKVVTSAVDVLSINPKSAEAMSLLGLAYVHAWQWQEGWKMLSKAKEMDASLALTELGFTLFYSAMGDIEGVKSSLAKANILDPLNEEIAEWGMWSLMMVNELDEAIKWGEAKQKLHPNLPYPLLSLAVAEYMNQNFDKSISLAAKGVQLSQREPFPLIILAQSYAAAGDMAQAKLLLEEAQAKNQYLCPYETAVIYKFLGAEDKIFSLLEQAVEYQSNCLIFSRNDPRFETLHNDPRYELLLKNIGLDDAAISQYAKE